MHGFYGRENNNFGRKFDEGHALIQALILKNEQGVKTLQGQRGKKMTETRIINNVKTLREERMMSKAELARKAGLSPLTIDRVESGKTCRLDTKRKIILALGVGLEDKGQVFADQSSAAGRRAHRRED